MSVLAEAMSVIVPREVLDTKYPGGLAAYHAACPNETFCTDEHLTRVGFMSPADVEAYVRRLESYGLVYLRGGMAIDLCVVDQHRGPTTQCDWIDGGKHADGYAAVWLAGADPSTMYAPIHWSPEQSGELGFVASKDAADRMIGLAKDEGIETMLDLNTGREVSVGRAEVTPAQASPAMAARAAAVDLRSLQDTIGGQLRESYKHREESGVICARCGAEAKPLAFHALEKNFDADVKLPRGAVPMSVSRGRVRTSFPLCSTCAPPCRKCALPRLTDRALEYGHALGATVGLGVCEHVQLRSFMMAILRRFSRTGRFRRVVQHRIY